VDFVTGVTVALVVLGFFFFFFFLRQSHYVLPGWLETNDLPASTSRVLGLQVCVTTPSTLAVLMC
jgi:hypothetical protein